ncbi:MAG TPA: ribonuclease E/G, partial [Gaiellaceae bacterium]
LMDAYGVEAEIKSTLNRRVDLPSGGYLIFDYAEAFTVIDVNTGRFVGSRSRSSGARLEDTITKNNLEAVKEVVRQLRLRDIGGIIVIDFIDMANPKNRATVEEALRTELERDRTKTYVVEISPLGLVEMTRQNVTDGPREVMTKKCPTCGGDGIVLSETSAAVDVERRLRALATGSRSQAYRVEVAAKVAALLVGPAASRLVELEKQTRRRFYIVGKEDTHLDHFLVLAEGKRDDLAPTAPVEEGAKVQVALGEVGLHDSNAGMGKVDGFDVSVAGAAKLVGKKVNVEIERVLDGMAYATLVTKTADVEMPITAEGEAEKPTRRPAAKKADVATEAAAEVEAEPTEDAPVDGEAPKKKTRRGSRGGRGRKKAATNGAAAPVEAKIHVPDPELGSDETDETAAAEAAGSNGDSGAAAEPKPKKKTRRGTRGGRNRRKKPATAAVATGEAEAEAPEAPATEWEYVPMSEWGDLPEDR